MANRATTARLAFTRASFGRRKLADEAKDDPKDWCHQPASADSQMTKRASRFDLHT